MTKQWVYLILCPVERYQECHLDLHRVIDLCQYAFPMIHSIFMLKPVANFVSVYSSLRYHFLSRKLVAMM